MTWYKKAALAVRSLRQPVTFNAAKRDYLHRQGGDRVLIELAPGVTEAEIAAHVKEALRQARIAREAGRRPTFVIHGTQRPIARKGLPANLVVLDSGAPIVEALLRSGGVDGADIIDLSVGRPEATVTSTAEMSHMLSQMWRADRSISSLVTVNDGVELLRRLLEYETEQILAQGSVPFSLDLPIRAYFNECMTAVPHTALWQFRDSRDSVVREYALNPCDPAVAREIWEQHEANRLATAHLLDSRSGDETLFVIATQHNTVPPFPTPELVARVDRAVEEAREHPHPFKFFVSATVHPPDTVSLAQHTVNLLLERGFDMSQIVAIDNSTSGRDEVGNVQLYVAGHQEVKRIVLSTSHAYVARKGVFHEMAGVPFRPLVCNFDPSQVWQMMCVEGTLAVPEVVFQPPDWDFTPTNEPRTIGEGLQENNAAKAAGIEPTPGQRL